MRTFFVVAALLVGSMSVTADQGIAPMSAVAVVSAAQQDPAPPAQPPAEPRAEPRQPAADPPPSAPPQVNVEIHERGWYASPMWIAIGVIGLVVLILIVAMASRTSGNTVIRG